MYMAVNGFNFSFANNKPAFKLIWRCIYIIIYLKVSLKWKEIFKFIKFHASKFICRRFVCQLILLE